jgi:hypothetical protein
MRQLCTPSGKQVAIVRSGHVRFSNALLFVCALALSAASVACDRRIPAEVVAAPVAAVSAGTAPVKPHGDHNPRHGGTVYMKDEMHYEVVLSASGRHRIYFSDAAREDLPASIASSVALTIERPQRPAEKIVGTIDEYGESWILLGEPVDAVGVSARVGFVVNDQGYWIDVPFITASTAVR